MPHMLMMIEPVGQRATRSEAEGREVYDAMLRWRDSLVQRDLLIAAESLVGMDKAVRLHKGGNAGGNAGGGAAGTAGGNAGGQAANDAGKAVRAMVLDGPFAEAKEMVGGFFLIKTDSHDEAVAIAHECPALEYLTVEVRAVAPCFA